MSQRINLAMVPKNSKGYIDYQQIPSMPVRVMVAEAEIQKMERWLKRVLHPTDSLKASDEALEETRDYLDRLKKRYQEWQALLAETA